MIMNSTYSGLKHCSCILLFQKPACSHFWWNSLLGWISDQKVHLGLIQIFQCWSQWSAAIPQAPWPVSGRWAQVSYLLYSFLNPLWRGWLGHCCPTLLGLLTFHSMNCGFMHQKTLNTGITIMVLQNLNPGKKLFLFSIWSTISVERTQTRGLHCANAQFLNEQDKITYVGS